MPLSQHFYRENQIELGKRLELESLAILYSGRLIKQSLDAEYPFYVDNNFYYLTGIEESDVTLLIKKDANGEVELRLFIDEPDLLKQKWVGKKISLEEAKAISGIQSVGYNSELEDYILKAAHLKNLYFDFSMPKHQSFATSDPKVKQMFVDMAHKNLQTDLAQMRLIKKEEEISVLREAIDITGKGITAVLENLKPGMKEYQIQAVFEYTIKSLGAQSVSFPTIAASGKNATILHYIKNQETLKAQEMVLFDLGARYKGYCGDISRTFPVSGRYEEASTSGQKIYDIVLETQKDLIQMYKVGVKMVDIQETTEAMFLEKCLSNNIIPPNNDIRAFYYHNLGHSLGLDNHDTNDKRDYCLEPGMVITCEPGLYVEELGVGVRIEDDILITEKGPENLSIEIPKEIDAVEKIMNP